MRNPTILPALFAALCVALACAGCEEDVVLVSGTDHVYSIYGVLNPQSDTQFVYVFPVEPSLEPGEAGPLDARVTTTDRQTGETATWSDSLVQDAQGNYAHLFYHPARVAYEHTYHLSVERSDGARSTVDVDVPPQVRVFPREASIGGEVWQPVDIVGTAPRLLQVNVDYWAHAVEGFTPTGFLLTDRHVVVAHDAQLTRTAGGWRLMINLTDAYQAVRAAFAAELTPELLSYGIQLSLVTVETIVANEAWAPPGGVFDPEILIVPEAMTNVEDGFGFVGAGYRIRQQWRPPVEAAAAAGFKPLA